MTTVATAFPIMLTSERASLMKRSIPRIRAMPASGIVGTTESVATRAMKPEPATPLAPFEVRTATRKIANCCWSVRSVLVRLRHEQGRQSDIDGASIRVEDVTGRHHEPDNG